MDTSKEKMKTRTRAQEMRSVEHVGKLNPFCLSDVEAVSGLHIKMLQNATYIPFHTLMKLI